MAGIPKFGKVLFSGSRFIFWVLSPFLLLFVFAMPFVVHEWWPWSNVLVFALDAIVVLLLLALYDVKRFWWAARGVTAIVFLSFVVYLADQIRSGKPWRFGQEPPLEALLGLLIVGLPSLRYTLVGRFGGPEP